MSPPNAKILEEEIYPIVKAVIPKSIRRPVGCEDHEELVQAISLRISVSTTLRINPAQK